MEAHRRNWDKVQVHLDDKVMVQRLNQGEGCKKETMAITEDIFLLRNLFNFCKFHIDYDCEARNQMNRILKGVARALLL